MSKFEERMERNRKRARVSMKARRAKQKIGTKKTVELCGFKDLVEGKTVDCPKEGFVRWLSCSEHTSKRIDEVSNLKERVKRLDTELTSKRTEAFVLYEKVQATADWLAEFYSAVWKHATGRDIVPGEEMTIPSTILALREDRDDLREQLSVARQAMDGKQPATDIYYHRLFSEQMKLRKEAEAKLEVNARCNSGHDAGPLKLWDCPACVGIIRDRVARLQAEVRRLRSERPYAEESKLEAGDVP